MEGPHPRTNHVPGGDNGHAVVITSLNSHDILMGRGSQANDYIGNLRYRRLVESTKPSFYAALSKEEKDRIGARTLYEIHRLGGRFLTELKDKNSGTAYGYREVTSPVALKKCIQSLRDRRVPVRLGNWGNNEVPPLDPPPPAHPRVNPQQILNILPPRPAMAIINQFNTSHLMSLHQQMILQLQAAALSSSIQQSMLPHLQQQQQQQQQQFMYLPHPNNHEVVVQALSRLAPPLPGHDLRPPTIQEQVTGGGGYVAFGGLVGALSHQFDAQDQSSQRIGNSNNNNNNNNNDKSIFREEAIRYCRVVELPRKRRSQDQPSCLSAQGVQQQQSGSIVVATTFPQGQDKTFAVGSTTAQSCSREELVENGSLEQTSTITTTMEAAMALSAMHQSNPAWGWDRTRSLNPSNTSQKELETFEYK